MLDNSPSRSVTEPVLVRRLRNSDYNRPHRLDGVLQSTGVTNQIKALVRSTFILQPERSYARLTYVGAHEDTACFYISVQNTHTDNFILPEPRKLIKLKRSLQVVSPFKKIDSRTPIGLALTVTFDEGVNYQISVKSRRFDVVDEKVLIYSRDTAGELPDISSVAAQLYLRDRELFLKMAQTCWPIVHPSNNPANHEITFASTDSSACVTFGFSNSGASLVPESAAFKKIQPFGSVSLSVPGTESLRKHSATTFDTHLLETPKNASKISPEISRAVRNAVLKFITDDCALATSKESARVIAKAQEFIAKVSLSIKPIPNSRELYSVSLHPTASTLNTCFEDFVVNPMLLSSITIAVDYALDTAPRLVTWLTATFSTLPAKKVSRSRVTDWTLNSGSYHSHLVDMLASKGDVSLASQAGGTVGNPVTHALSVFLRTLPHFGGTYDPATSLVIEALTVTASRRNQAREEVVIQVDTALRRYLIAVTKQPYRLKFDGNDSDRNQLFRLLASTKQ